MENKLLKDLERAWSKFIKQDTIESYVDTIISESWKLCKQKRVDHTSGFGQRVDEDSLQYILSENRELLEVARSIMHNLNSFVLGSGFVLVLADAKSYIIETIGEENVKKEAGKINFALGSLWSEEAVGTNAIGLCLREDIPIQVIGAEHYCQNHHPWTCSAAPIHDDKGRVIGCLDMTGSVDKAHKHTLGIVVAAAYSIEKQMALLRSHELIDTTIESVSDGMIIIDKNYKINKINNKALRILGLSSDEVYTLDIKSILKDIDLNEIISRQKTPVNFIDCNFYIKDRRISCSVNIAPVITRNHLIGIAVVFKEIKSLHNTVNTVAGNKATYTFNDIITVDNKMKSIINGAKKIAKTGCCVLIEGESGTGKELFAHSIHNSSNRAHGPFVAINCATLPRDLVESELFGYEKGAFTGAAKEGKPGKFELADGGTIFLDEIGELPLDLQAKLLRVLDNMTITRIGGKYEKRLNVRVVAATNRSLYEEVKKRNFREDLYYRLNVFKLHIPPLRERIDDIEVCAKYFLDKLNNTHFTSKSFSEDFIKCIKQYKWKGNVRELQNIVERAYYLSDENTITEEYLPEEIVYTWNDTTKFSIKSLEKKAIENALIQSKGHVIEAAKLLNMSRSSIYRKIKRHNIDVRKYGSMNS